MIRVKCPLCARSFEIEQLGDLPSFPFCTERCKMIDLGRWIDGAYAIPDKSQAEPTGTADLDDEDDG